MSDIQQLMAHDHRACDDAFARIEQALAKEDWPQVSARLGVFCDDMERHLGVEEQVLFPAFEEVSGMTMGPTRVMRMEHEQMRSLFEALREAVAARDADALRGEAETLLIMMQQHNLKEENVLYPMCDQHLAAESAVLCGTLAEVLQRPA